MVQAICPSLHYVQSTDELLVKTKLELIILFQLVVKNFLIYQTWCSCVSFCGVWNYTAQSAISSSEFTDCPLCGATEYLWCRGTTAATATSLWCPCSDDQAAAGRW